MPSGQLGSVGLLLDGKVSLLGLTAAVDDLSITYLVPVGSPLDPHAWVVDLAGLAVTADFSGLSLAGGLRKFPVSEGGVQYLGMLLAKLAVYGISVYGGYGLVGPPGDQYASLFLFGAVNGPIGGPPAFFVTGIGGGFGINRDLIYPSDLTQFNTYPFIKALDPAARPGDPMTELDQIRGFFPPDRGSFWFAAGLSFTLLRPGRRCGGDRRPGRRRVRAGPARAGQDGPAPAAGGPGQHRAGPAGPGLHQGGRGPGAGRAHRQLLAAVPGHPAHRRVRLRLLVRRAQPRPARADPGRLPPGLPPGRLPGGAPARPVHQPVRLPVHHRPDLLRADLRGRHGRGSPSPPAPISASPGRTCASAATGSSSTTRSGCTSACTRRSAPGSRSTSGSARSPSRCRCPRRWTCTGRRSTARPRFSVGPSSLTVPFGDRPPDQPAALSWAEFVPKYLQEASAGIAHVLGAVSGPGAQVPAGSAATGGARTPGRQRRQPVPGHPRVHADRDQPGPGPRAGGRRHHHRPADRARGVGRADAAAGPADGHPRLHRPGARQPAGPDRRSRPEPAAGRLVPDRGLGPGPDPGRRQGAVRRRAHRRGPGAADRVGAVGAQPRVTPRTSRCARSRPGTGGRCRS